MSKTVKIALFKLLLAPKSVKLENKTSPIAEHESERDDVFSSPEDDKTAAKDCRRLTGNLVQTPAEHRQQHVRVNNEATTVSHCGRRCRTTYSPWQLHQLESSFEQNPYPDVTQRDHLATVLDITESRIQVSVAKQIS